MAVSRTTLQGALRAWGVRKNGSKDDDEGLRDRIRSLFYEGVYSDQEMLKRLRSEGFELQQRRLQSMRLDMGLRKRDSAANEEESNENAVQLVREVLEGGNCGSYGIGLLHTAIRRQGHILSRYGVRAREDCC